jgi:hypothetical protein
MKAVKRNGLWVIFAIFVVAAISLHSGEPLFASQGPYAAGKYISWIAFFLFTAYSIYCSSRENIFKTIGVISRYHWARQIGIDLYLGVGMFAFLVYLNEGSVLILLFWLAPFILFANLAVLLYVAMNYDTIISHFV